MATYTHSCRGTPHDCGEYTQAWRGDWSHNIECELDCGHEGPHEGKFKWDY